MLRPLLVSCLSLIVLTSLPAQIWDVHEVFVELPRGGRDPAILDLAAIRLTEDAPSFPSRYEASLGSPDIIDRISIAVGDRSQGGRTTLAYRMRIGSMTQSTSGRGLPSELPEVIMPRGRSSRGVRGHGRGFRLILIRPRGTTSTPLEHLDGATIVRELARVARGEPGRMGTDSAAAVLGVLPLMRYLDSPLLEEIRTAADVIQRNQPAHVLWTTSELGDRVRLLSGEFDVAERWLEESEMMGRRMMRGRIVSLNAAYSMADDPRSRGLMGWLIASASDPEPAFIEAFSDAVRNGEVILPGDPETQRRYERELEAMRSRRNIGTAAFAVLGGIAAMGATVFLLRRVARRAVA